MLAFGYDWRLSCRRNSARPGAAVERALDRWRASAASRREARVVFTFHSMGGLVARYYVECRGGHGIARRLITLGTPHRGSPDALLHLVNGVHRGRGRLAVDLTAFARSLPSLHELLPGYRTVVQGLAPGAYRAEGQRAHGGNHRAAAGEVTSDPGAGSPPGRPSTAPGS
ncbi:esterase/lipase family protein [Kitasatospora cystarginea]